MGNKKTVEIKGTPIYLVAVGMSAFISEHDGVRRTSTVLKVKEISSAEIRFETHNTNYRLHLIRASDDMSDYCMVEHCLSTNCLVCAIGKYPDCQFLSIKHFYQSECVEKE